MRIADISPEEVREMERFKDYSDEQVILLIETIKKYTRTIYGIYSKQKKSGRKFALSVESQKTKIA